MYKLPCQISLVKRKAKKKVNSLYLCKIKRLHRCSVCVRVWSLTGVSTRNAIWCIFVSFTTSATFTRQVNTWLMSVEFSVLNECFGLSICGVTCNYHSEIRPCN